MLAALVCAALCTLSQDPAVLLVRVLDVSDARMGGDAILVTDSAAGRARHVLIDASDRGRTVVARLAAFRVDTLALVILSHPHADHYGGLSAVLRRFPVRRFVYGDRKSTRLNSSHLVISYAVFCLKKKKKKCTTLLPTPRRSVACLRSVLLLTTS